MTKRVRGIFSGWGRDVAKKWCGLMTVGWRLLRNGLREQSDDVGG